MLIVNGLAFRSLLRGHRVLRLKVFSPAIETRRCYSKRAPEGREKDIQAERNLGPQRIAVLGRLVGRGRALSRPLCRPRIRCQGPKDCQEQTNNFGLLSSWRVTTPKLEVLQIIHVNDASMNRRVGRVVVGATRSQPNQLISALSPRTSLHWSILFLSALSNLYIPACQALMICSRYALCSSVFLNPVTYMRSIRNRIYQTRSANLRLIKIQVLREPPKLTEKVLTSA